MTKRILTLQDLGEAEAWLLMQQANGIPDPRSRSSFMAGRTALMMFKDENLADRLCATAAVRQMGGEVVYVSKGRWLEDMHKFPIELSPIYDYYVDCAYIQGISVEGTREKSKYIARIPTINIASDEAAPAHALADLACIVRFSGKLDGAKVAWMGAPNGTLYSLMEAAEWFPFEMRLALPNAETLNKRALEHARKNGAKITLAENVTEAVQGADYLCVGCHDGVTEETRDAWRVDGRLLELAPQAYVLITSRIIADTLPVLPQILEGPRCLVLLQSENRLRVHKRMLHWVFNEDE